jgi:tripartite-type tricarboxylate transporter receptor subunit TctC
MLFERGAGVAFKSIPYKGGAPLLQDLLGGQVPIAFNVTSEVLQHVQGRAAAVAGGGQPAALGQRCPRCPR